MASNKPWKRSRSKRHPDETRDRRRVLIVCEDSKSARDYFGAFPVDPRSAEVRTLGEGMNTDSLVERTQLLKHHAEQAGRPWHEIWCVFDRDNFPLQNYHRAFQLAEVSGINIAWANEAFELWYLLHFNYHDSGISRNDFKAKLKPHFAYDKADAMIYQTLKPHRDTAMRNARRLERHWHEMGEKYPERQNPSTSVHRLVEYLNELADLGGVE